VAFHHAGANARYGETGLAGAALAGTRALLLTGFPLMQALRGPGYRQMLAHARTLGALVAVDIGPAIGTPASLAELAELLPLVDLLIANEHELAVATGAAALEGQLAAVAAAGAGTVVVKRGAAGVRLCNAGSHMDAPAFPVVAVQTVGAGDAFNAGLLAALAEGRSLEEAARFGNAVAACIVRAPAGIMAAPDRAAVEAMVAGAI
jgi:sugar/nucleoside kinase (ribokinase family)